MANETPVGISDPPRPGATPNPDQSQVKQNDLNVYESLILDIRSRRMPVDEGWLRYHSAYLGQAVRQQYQGGMFNHYIPAARRAVERFISRLVEMLTPSNAFFEVYPLDEYGDQAGKKAEAVWRYLLYLLTKKIKLGNVLRQLGRTHLLYGRCISKFTIKLESIPSKKIRMVWPDLRAVDPFCFYAWPETVNDLDECVICFEDTFMPWEKYDEMAQEGVVDPIPQKELSSPTWPTHYTARLARKSLTSPSNTNSGTPAGDAASVSPAHPVRFVELTEMWAFNEGKWMLRRIAWNCNGGPRLVKKVESPFGRHPYRWALSRSLPGEQFSTGMMDDLEPLQVALNDQVNMTMEGQAVSMSPPTCIDPNLVSRPNSIVFKPRARWYMDPAGAKVLEVPNTAREGILGVNMFLGFIDSFAGSNPLAEGQPGRNMPRAGFAVSTLLNLSLADIRDVARCIEDNILTPSLGDLYRLTMEFVPKQQQMAIPGTQGMDLRRVSPVDLLGDWEFNWVGSIQAQDYQVRAQRLISTLGVILKGIGPLQQQLAAEGKKLNFQALFTRIWRDGLGERGADSIIVPMSPEEQEKFLQPPPPEPPKRSVNVSLKGELPPEVAMAMAEGQPSPQPPAGPASSSMGRQNGGPATEAGMDEQMTRQMGAGLQERGNV